MKKFVFLLCAGFLFAVSGHAQNADQSRKEKAKDRVQNMDSTQKQKYRDKGVTKDHLKELNLSKDQKKQVGKIIKQARQDKNNIRTDASLSDEEKKAKLDAIEKDAKEKMMALMNDEQKAKMKNYRGNVTDDE